MKINYNVTGTQRRALADAISELTGGLRQDAGGTVEYMGAPSFGYRVCDHFEVLPNGIVDILDSADSELVETVLDGLAERGFNGTPATPAFEDLRMTAEEELGLGRQHRDPCGEDGMQSSDVPEAFETDEQTVADGDTATTLPFTVERDEDCQADDTLPIYEMGLAFCYPREEFTDTAIANLCRIVESKADLIKKALGADDEITVHVTETQIILPWFTVMPYMKDAEVYAEFASALCDMAKKQSHINAKPHEVKNEKYTFRCFLLRLGFIGDRYKAQRKVLLRNLEGSSAFRQPKEDENNEDAE